MPAGIALVGKFLFPRRRMLIKGQAALFLIATLAVGPGLITNTHVEGSLGPGAADRRYGVRRDQPFHPVVGPTRRLPEQLLVHRRRAGRRVLDHGAGSACAAAMAARSPTARRSTFGIAVGVLRIAGGGHFFTDVVFAGVFVYLEIWLVYCLIYRWPATALSEDAIEAFLVEPVRGYAKACAS